MVVVVVTRACGGADSKNSCSYNDINGVKSTACVCTGNLCNGAGAKATSISMLLGFVVVTMLF